MIVDTKFATFALFALVASACVLDDEDAQTTSTESAIRIPPPPGPVIPLCPADPPQIFFETPYVGNANSNAIIVHDSDVYWANEVVRTEQEERDFISRGFTVNAVAIWEIGRRAAAFAQMYDLLAPIDSCRAGFYLERLRVMADELLKNRDDLRTSSPVRPVDYFRGRVMAAWGAAGVDRDSHWNTDIVTAGLFTYPMAAFARRVATNSSAFGPGYQQEAIRFTTAVIETYISFQGDLHLTQPDPWAYFVVPPTYASLLCNFPGPTQCAGYKANAGQPVSWNENLSFMKSLAEAAVAADSALYRSSPDSPAKTNTISLGAEEAPMLIAKNVKFFMENVHFQLWGGGEPGVGYYTWNHEYHAPFSPQPQNTAHGQFELASLAVINEDAVWLNAILARQGRPGIVYTSAYRSTFATTFLRFTWSPDNILSENINGTGNRSAANNANEECAGFIPLAQVDSWVWVRCRDATFKFGGDLREDNYAALLRYR